MNSLRTIGAIAATYAYFLLFAQFAFLEGLGDTSLKPAMAAMGLGGILGCLATPRLAGLWGARRLMQAAFLLNLLVAVLSLTRLPGLLTGALIGFALGTLTVALAGTLRESAPDRRAGWIVGWGTGLAYALCNVPALFEASWQVQTVAAAAFSLLGLLSVPSLSPPERNPGPVSSHPFAVVLLLLLALVWLDSAAFFIIQHTDTLKKATWDHGQLWRNGALHLGAAVAAGWVLDRGRLAAVLVSALALLSLASQMINLPALAPAGGWLYPVGVSLYSVALVAYPGILSGARTPDVALNRAALLFAVAGWIGSALGVGMGENLHYVPGWFVMVAWVPVALLAWKAFGRPASLPVAAALVLLPAILWVARQEPAGRDHSSAVARGREVYLSEGCIHCHSRYVRPHGEDALTRGPARKIDDLLREEPVLIGNRRQGPDLLQVGVRRSARWLELHFREPRTLSPGSTMPPYQHLWNDGRGDDLVAFLTDNTAADWSGRLQAVQNWEPTGEPSLDGKHLFTTHCAMCHGEQGLGDGTLAARLVKPPANLVDGILPFSGPGRSTDPPRLNLARIIKFGIPGTDMPGHEHLRDGEVLALAEHVLSLRRPAETLTSLHE